MPITIKMIEDLSLNAWPSWQMQVYDGWILRFSHFYTHRTNCAEQIGQSMLPLAEKVDYCEKIYREWGTPCIFKIQPIGDPALDPYLEQRGYHIEHSTTVMVKSLENAAENPPQEPLKHPYISRVTDKVDTMWLDTLFTLKGETKPIHRHIVPNMYAAIPKKQIAVLIFRTKSALPQATPESSTEKAVSPAPVPEGFQLQAAAHTPVPEAALPQAAPLSSARYYIGAEQAEIIGTGLGILDRDTVGVYAIHVDPSARRQGVATSIVSTILAEGARQGAKNAYLQVVSDNAPAKSLYRSLGFREYYRYFFRVK